MWCLHAHSHHAVNLLHLVGLVVSAEQLKYMVQDIIYSPWEGTTVLWLCFMAKLLLFYLAWLLYSLSALLWLNVLLGIQGRPRRLKLLYKQKAEDPKVSDSRKALKNPVQFQKCYFACGYKWVAVFVLFCSSLFNVVSNSWPLAWSQIHSAVIF